MSTFCTVCNNSVKQSHISFFMYPLNDIKRLKWLQAVNREDLYVTLQDKKKRNSLKICEEHFEMKYIKSIQKKVLSDDAIPTLKLNKPSNPNINPCQDAIEGSNDIVCISMDECNINSFKIPTLQLGEIENSSQVNINRGMKETEKVVDSGINKNSFPTINLEEKRYQDSQGHSVSESQRKIPTLQLGEIENSSQVNIHRGMKEAEKAMDSRINVNSFPTINLEEKLYQDLQRHSVSEGQRKLDFVKTFDGTECSRKTHVWIPRDVITAVQSGLQLSMKENCRKINIHYKTIRNLRVIKERLERKRTGIKRSLAILRQKYGLKDRKQRLKKPLQDPFAEIDLLDIKEEKINEKLQMTEMKTNTLNEDTQTSNKATCVEVVREPLPIKFEVFDETEEDTAPVHLMTSHMSMADPISNMSDFLMPAVNTPTPIPVTATTSGQEGALDDFDKFALSLAKSMKNLNDAGDKIDLVMAMQNLVSEYVIRDLKKTFPNASFSSDAQNTDAVQTLISSIRSSSENNKYHCQ